MRYWLQCSSKGNGWYLRLAVVRTLPPANVACRLRKQRGDDVALLLGVDGVGFGRLDHTWLSKMPPAPMGYFTSPPMFDSGLTFRRHSAERSTPIQMLSMPLMFRRACRSRPVRSPAARPGGGKVELLARVVGLGRQRHGLGVVVEVEVDLPGLGIVAN